jgi:hypothetical protein
MKRIYEIFNHETNEREFVTEEVMENYYPELKAGTIEIVDEYDSEEFEHPNLPSLEELAEIINKTYTGE